MKVSRALSDEARAFLDGVRGLEPDDWDRPTRCTPWDVRELVGHVVTALDRVPENLARPAPDRPDTTAVTYYRADARFSAAANAERIRTAQARAATTVTGAATSVTGAGPGVTGAHAAVAGAGPGVTGANAAVTGADAGVAGALAAATAVDAAAATVTAVLDACAREPDGRLIRTRHGDAMLLSEFLVTRVVELALHGLDVSDAAGRPPWLTPAATDCVLGLLFTAPPVVAGLGWDPVTVLRKTTGRAPVTPAEAEALARAGRRKLAFG
ncbi:maleylpyruvate isomerase N-terminal domain-containing protein [Actinoplanes sp. CA-030573]|uniref:maleylpyruvate isomerase N-terminal domain-containing protein n=1 Tax=Actinoplanes sp. CA-030573 TaxID=3239898 RepID=UPI003D8A538F